MAEIKLRSVMVEWLDAESYHKWAHIKDCTGPRPVYSIGWLVKDEPDWIGLALSWGPESPESEEFEVNNYSAIPRGMVKEIKDILPCETS